MFSKTSMKSAVIFSALLFAAQTLQAATISIDLGDNVDISGAELVGAPGVADAADNWINATSGFTGTSGSGESGDNLTGVTVGGVTVTWDGNYYGDAANGTSDENHTMMDGFMALNAVSTTFVTVTGLGTEFTSNGYDVYVYVASDTTRTHGLTGSDNASNSVDMVSATTADGQFLADGGNYDTTPSYVILSGFTGSEFTLTRGPSGDVPQIAGIQFVSSAPATSAPEPGSVLLLVVGGVMALIQRRRRKRS